MEHHKRADNAVADLLGALHTQLLGIHAQLRGMEHKMSKALDDLRAQVAANTTVIASAKALIGGIAARIDAAGVDAAALAALSAELKAADDELSSAVTAGTPAALPTDPPVTMPAVVGTIAPAPVVAAPPTDVPAPVVPAAAPATPPAATTVPA